MKATKNQVVELPIDLAEDQPKKGVYGEVSAQVFNRLQNWRHEMKRRKQRKLNSNYKIIEAALSAFFDALDAKYGEPPPALHADDDEKEAM